MAKRAKRQKEPRVLPAQEPPRPAATPGPPVRGTRSAALDKIFADAEELGEGFRHGVVGMPRMGKTYHAQSVIDEALEREVVAWAFVHDAKKPDEVQYEGTVRENVEALTADPLSPEDSPVIVFHPDPGTVHRPSVEEVSLLGLAFGRRGMPSLVAADELFHGMKSAQVWDDGGKREPTTPTFPHLLREGSSQNVSTLYTTQIPQQLPTEALDLPETMAVFRLKARSARYIARVFDLPDAVVEIIRRLGRGEFLLFDGDDWDGTIYGPS